MKDDLDTSADNRPNVGSKPGTRSAACGEQIAFKESTVCSNSMEVEQGYVIAPLK